MMRAMQTATSHIDLAGLAERIKSWGRALGFQAVAISDIQLDAAEAGLLRWLEQGYHGTMDYMAKHGLKRARPAELMPGTLRVISCAMDYLPPDARPAAAVLAEKERAYIARYALGRDYHKVLRNRLERLAQQIRQACPGVACRVFTDSAPVLEVELATRAGVGWRGKHTLLLQRERGSWCFLGEIFINLALPADAPVSAHCGDCRACLDSCPTAAIVAPYRVDARRCISYLTIEHRGAIPMELRPLIGNRIYGCDDCQLVCPWNRFATPSSEADFAVRHGLDQATLAELFSWDEATFRRRMAGSAILRIGHERWLRNIAVALGNAPTTPEVLAALQCHLAHPSAVVREHLHWARQRHGLV